MDFFGLRLIYDTLWSIIDFVWSIIGVGYPRRIASDPLTDVVNFIAQFEAKFGTSHPAFFRGSYNDALAEAKRDLKFLLVYLHAESHQDTEAFCGDVLAHPEVISYIARNNIIFWACCVRAPEGYRVSSALKENTYPFLGLIGLKENNRMLLVRRFEGKTNVERLLAQLQQGIEDNEASLVAARADRHELTMNQQIRRDQDLAYEESLKADQEKEKKRRAEQEKRDAEQKLVKEKEQAEQDLRTRLLKLKVELADRIPAEPAATDENVIRLLVKLPNGTRLERRFKRNTSLKVLAFFIFCQEQSPVSFQIFVNMPRKELPVRPPTLDNPECTIKDETTGATRDPPTFEEFGLGSSEMLFVQDLEA